MKKKYAIAGGVAAASAVAAYTIWQKTKQWKPKEAFPVTGFDIHKYLGKWYELARLDYRFEKNLTNTTAEYSLKDDGSVKVINRGFNARNQKWEQVEGVALFREEKDKAALKVSFFKPFYSGYNVIALDTYYRYAMVAGKDLDYLWILSREKSIPDDIRESYLKIARGIGYETEDLIWVDHSNRQQDQN